MHYSLVVETLSYMKTNGNSNLHFFNLETKHNEKQCVSVIQPKDKVIEIIIIRPCIRK